MDISVKFPGNSIFTLRWKKLLLFLNPFYYKGIQITQALYLENMYLQQCDAQIISIKDEKLITLNQTVFYPKSGGVDHDQGVLIRKQDQRRFQVISAKKDAGEIVHEISEGGLQVGDEIIAHIDWYRRYELMRYHTAAHVLSGVFFLEGNVKVSGNNLIVGQGRIDFTFPEFDRTYLEKLVLRANEIITQNHKIRTYTISRSEMQKDPSLLKLVMGIPIDVQIVRIVEIENFDRQPDGGCHVKELHEIGTIFIDKIENKGKNNRRLYFQLK